MPKFFSKTWSKTDFDRIRELISIADESGAAEVEIEADGVRVLVRQYAAPAAQPVPSERVSVITESISPISTPSASTPESPSPEPSIQSDVESGTPILSPTPGTFYAKPAPDVDPFVQVGDRIRKGQTVCIVEAMKLMNEVESEVDGVVLKIAVNDGDAVEYDQPLLFIDSSE